METVEMSFKEVDLKFHFVVKDGTDEIENVSSDMSAAFGSISEYVEEDMVLWITEEDLMKTVPEVQLTKKYIFVLESFDGRAFDYLKTTKALVIGPRCMLSCLMDNTSIPLGTSPIFTAAMRGLIVCPSGLIGMERANVKNLVQWMGGYYTDDLSSNCTHLVSNTVKSNKYEKAALNNITVMHPDWVHDVWERSKKENILATSREFFKHKLPIFYDLYITTSGLSNSDKSELVKLVNENGGHYTGPFRSSQTDILITEKDKTDSQKYQAAARCKKYCLIPQWITDSVKKGYALPTEHYTIVGLKVSTPTKMEKSVSATDFNPDCTQLSEISRMDSMRPNSTVNETIANMSVASTVKSAPAKPARPAYKDILAQISTQQAKKAGAFLDGCCVYLAGFTADEKEKLNKILNVGGAIRFDEINEKITHCVVGEPTQNELNKIGDHAVIILSLEWLLESIKHKLPVQEEKFIYRAKVAPIRAAEPPSPSSKKTIESMNHSFKKPAAPKSRLDFMSAKASTSKALDMDGFEDEQNDFLSQYTPENAVPLPPKSTPDPQPAPTSATNQESEGFDSEMCTEDYNNLNFFIGFTVHVHDHDEEIHQQLVDDCENAGAKLVDKSFKGVADYAIVPSEEPTELKNVKVEAKHIVNNLWIEEAIKENKIVDIKYYHAPIPTSVNVQPLTGMVIVISVYSNSERVYIETLATLLGATKQDSYAKKNKPLLVCPTPEGAKYNAAIKWDYPVVKSDWLVECASKGQKVSLEPYLVGDSVLTLSGSWSVTKSSSSASSDISGQAEGKSRLSSTASKGTSDLSDAPLENDVFHPPKMSPRKGTRSFGSIDNLENIEHPSKDPINAKRGSRSDSGKQSLEDDRNSVSTLADENTVLRHRRLSELIDPGRRSSKSSPLSSPVTTTSPATPTTPATPTSPCNLNISDIIKEISTPNRDILYQVYKEMQSKDTPESQRIKKLIATPGAQKTPPTPKIPDFVLTPEVRKRRLAFFDSYYLPPARPRKPSTPLKEIKRRMWIEALGDQYWEEGKYNTQAFSQTTEDDAGTSSGLGRETQNATDSNIHVKRLSDFIKNREVEKQNRNDNQPLPEFETESAPHNIDSEMGGTEEMIGWRDPSEFTQGARAKAKQMKHTGTPRFSISCTNDLLRRKIQDQIIELSGEVCESMVKYSEKCTHILCERPNRGERILSGIAAGKWILDLSYIGDSMKAGNFLDEELYEWGNPKAINLPELTASEQPIANAAFRWRKKMFGQKDKSQAGAFNGFRVILHVTKIEQFQNLIIAGGGEVVPVQEPYAECEEALRATHCLVENKKKLLAKDHKQLAGAGVLVLSIMYLNAHLISEVQADYKKHLLSY